MTAPALTLYLPRDAAARSVGADEVAAALSAEARRRGQDLRLVRTGTRGALWLEPLLEVAGPGGRIAYGPVVAADVPDLFDALLSDGAGMPAEPGHPLRLGPPEEIPFLADQQRLTFARCGVIDPLDLEDYRRHGGLAGLRAALALPPAEVVERVAASGLRGRGGAGFPAGIKWRTVLQGEGPKYIVCNADEGDSGTFADRILMEGDPSLLIEGMVIAGLAVGAAEGFVYIRSEYPDAIATMRAAIGAWEAAGLLGGDVDGSGRAFRLHLRRGAGAYICGEESALLESLEGRRGQVRARPPIPATAGLFGRPTVVNNVLTLAAVPTILADGAEAYAALGRGRSLGTQAFQLAGNVARGGLVELPFGVTLRTLVEGFGGGTRSGRPLRAVQVGGPLGAYLPAGRLDLPADYEALAEAGAMLGHGGITVFDDRVDMLAQARFAMAFCAAESCGKCTPCRLGAQRGTEVLDRWAAGADPAGQRAVLEDLCEVMRDGSLCAMGGLTPMPVLSALEHFPEDFEPNSEEAAA